MTEYTEQALRVFSRKVCVAVSAGAKDIIEIAKASNLSEKTVDDIVGRLCGEGVLDRDKKTHAIAIRNEARAGDYAADPRTQPAKAPAASPVTRPVAPASPPPARAPAPQAAAPAPPQQRRRVARPVFPVPSKIEIRKGIPIPPSRTARRDVPWPFAGMSPGDSFVVEVPEGWQPQQVARRLTQDVIKFRKTTPSFRAVVRVADDGKTVGLWRSDSLSQAPQESRVPAQVTAGAVRKGANGDARKGSRA